MFGETDKEKKVTAADLRELAEELKEEADKQAAVDSAMRSFRSKFKSQSKGSTIGGGKRTTAMKLKPPSVTSPTLTKVKK